MCPIRQRYGNVPFIFPTIISIQISCLLYINSGVLIFLTIYSFVSPYLYFGLSYHIALNSLTMPFASNSKHCLICMYLTPLGIGGLGFFFFSFVLNRAFLVHWSPCCRYLSKVLFTSHHVVDDVISASCYV